MHKGLRRACSGAQKRRLSTCDVVPLSLHQRNLLEEYTLKEQTPSSLQSLMRTGRGDFLQNNSHNRRLVNARILIHVAGFLRNELPIRLAHRIRDLDEVPLMKDMPSVQAVKQVYTDSFVDLVQVPSIHTPADEEAFASCLDALYAKHSNVLIQMAKGAFELREQMGGDFAKMTQCHTFLDRFYTSRIGIRVLAGQYLALRRPPMMDYIGMICLKTSPNHIVRQAISDATMMCIRRYGRAPKVEVNGRLDLTFPYIPTYLHYILVELLKNALRATAEKHMEEARLPSVAVVIADGDENEDVVIKVMDEGGGIPRSQMEKIWSYLFTTADPKIQEAFIGDNDHGNESPIAGLGYGLPISRSYCRYFGGDLALMSMEGYGTDAFLHLKRIGDSMEPVPV